MHRWRLHQTPCHHSRGYGGRAPLDYKVANQAGMRQNNRKKLKIACRARSVPGTPPLKENWNMFGGQGTLFCSELSSCIMYMPRMFSTITSPAVLIGCATVMQHITKLVSAVDVYTNTFCMNHQVNCTTTTSIRTTNREESFSQWVCDTCDMSVNCHHI